MKLKRKIVAAVAVLLILVLGVLALADGDAVEYTGNKDEALTLIGEYDKANSEKVKLKALDKAYKYVLTVDPESEGIDEVYTAIDDRILDLGTYYLDNIGNMATASEKHAGRDVIRDLLLSYPFLSESDGNKAYLTALDTATMEIALGYIGEISLLDDAREMHAVLDKIGVLTKDYKIVLSDADKSLLDAEVLRTLEIYVSLFGGVSDAAGRGALLREIKGFMREHADIPVSDKLDGLLSSIASETLTYERELEEARLKLYNQAGINDFVAPVRVNRTFDGGDTGMLTPMGNVVNKETISFVGEDFGKDGENHYYTVSFDKAKTHVRTSMDLTSISDGLVVEFDFTTFGSLPDTCIWFEDVGRTNGATWSIMYFSITPDGHIAADASGKEIIFKNAITPGEWTHISLTVDHSTADVKLYVDYVLVYETNKRHPTYGYTYSPETFIMGANPTKAGASFSIDNVKVYGGASPRDLNWYSSLKASEVFLFVSEQIENSDLSPKARREYYEEAKRLLPTYYSSDKYLTNDPDIIEAVDVILNFDIENLKLEISDANLLELEEMYKNLSSLSKGEATLKQRSYWLASLDTFIGTAGGLIPYGDRYAQVSAGIADERYRIDMENRAAEFTAAVNAFYSASTVSLKQASCDTALALVGELDLVTLNDRSLYPSLYDAIARAGDMENILYEYVCIDNSKKLLACITYVLGGNETEEDWQRNYDKLKGYVAQARALIKEGNIDVYYGDLEELIEKFAPMNQYFFDRLQEEHIAHITSELNRYDNSDVYFEKFGILSKLKEYSETEEVDLEDETVKALLTRVDEELELMKGAEEEYDALLKVNTERFVEICEGLLGSVDYLTMKRIVEEASVYYYTMSVDVAAVQDALAVYKVRRDEVKAKENLANEFILKVELINTASESALGEFIECNTYLDRLDKDVQGVTDAIALLGTKMAAFDSSVADINAEIESTVLEAAYQCNYRGMGSLVTLIIREMIG